MYGVARYASISKFQTFQQVVNQAILYAESLKIGEDGYQLVCPRTFLYISLIEYIRYIIEVNN